MQSMRYSQEAGSVIIRPTSIKMDIEESCRGHILWGAVSRARKANTCFKQAEEANAGRMICATVVSFKEGRGKESNCAPECRITASVARIRPPRYSFPSHEGSANGSKVGRDLDQKTWVRP